MPEKITKSAYKLFKRVIELSESKEWDEAKKEWEQIDITQADKEEDYGSCICGKYPIKEMIQLFNSKNKKEIIVGNCCINKFFGNPEYNKIFAAIKKGKVNKSMIKDSFEKGVVNGWEEGFMNDNWKKRKLTLRQEIVFNEISSKILGHYKKKLLLQAKNSKISHFQAHLVNNST